MGDPLKLPDDFTARCFRPRTGWGSGPPVTLESVQRAMDMVNHAAPTDEPRLVVIVDPDRVRELQAGLVERGIKDVLVQPDHIGVCAEGQAITIDPRALADLGVPLSDGHRLRLRS